MYFHVSPPVSLEVLTAIAGLYWLGGLRNTDSDDTVHFLKSAGSSQSSYVTLGTRLTGVVFYILKLHENLPV